MPELNDDPGLQTTQTGWRTDDLVDVLNGYFRKKTSDVWLDELDVAGVPAGPILSIGEMLEHPQALARDMIVETEHERLGAIKGLGMAVKFHGAESIDSRPRRCTGNTPPRFFSSSDIRIARFGSFIQLAWFTPRSGSDGP